MNIAIEIGRRFDAALAASIDRQGGPHVDLDSIRRYADACVNSPEWLRANLREFHVELREEMLAVAALAVEADPRQAKAYIEAVAELRAALHDIAYEGNDVQVTP